MEIAVTPQQREVGTDQFSFRCVVYSVSPEHGGVVSVLSSVSTFTDAGAHIKFAHLKLESCQIRERKVNDTLVP